MKRAAAEFSRLVPLARIGGEPFCREIVADAEERAALARRFDLASIERLTATVELLRQRQDTVLLRAAYHAVFEQYCVISLEPVAGILEEEFALRYGPPEAEDAASDAAGEEEAFEPLSGDAIDIGEAVAQEFSLALPPFPRDPAAVIEVASDEFAPAYRDVPGSSEMPDEVAGDENRADNPFGALARWRK